MLSSNRSHQASKDKLPLVNLDVARFASELGLRPASTHPRNLPELMCDSFKKRFNTLSLGDLQSRFSAKRR